MKQFHKVLTRRPVGLLVLLLVSLFFAGAYLSLRLGARFYSHHDLMTVLAHPLTNSDLQDIIIDIRLPRLIAAVLVGAGLASSGAILQGVTRNPIADPSLLGINTGAALALVISHIYFPNLHYSLRLLSCLLGAGMTALLIFGLSLTKRQGYQQLRLILSGVMISSLFQAIGQALTIRFNLSTALIGWQSGGLMLVNWTMLKLVVPFMLLGLMLSQALAHQLTVLNLTDSVAKGLGQRVELVTFIAVLLALILSASSVALVGSLSFVGLIIPHFIKQFVPQNYKKILPLTVLTGATFLVWADLLSRLIAAPYETPLTAIVSLVGLPCFLWLLRKEKHL